MREMALIGEAHLDGNLGEGKRRGKEQLAGAPDSASADIF
jgi:hypothetical protein